MSTNYATMFRRQLITRVSKLIYVNDLNEKLDRLTIEMHPKGKQTLRCCIHKSRAVNKYRAMAFLGFNTEDETDELAPLSYYAQKAKERTDHTDVMMTVVDEACSSCVKSSYSVSNLCRGCVGRHCSLSCNKSAISFINGQAHIDTDKCVNCGMCMKSCPFHAIIYQPVPCEESCPVGAISKNDSGIEHIDPEKCILCGKCLSACPFGAIMEKSSLLYIFEKIREGKKVVAMVAPAIAGQFKTEFGRVISAIRQLGFSDVVEVALGANVTSKNEAHEFEERMEEGQPFMTTSCCPSYMLLVKKHLPELTPYVSTTLSPMAYTAQIVKQRDPEAVTVFIGPCVAKRYEGFYNRNVDYVMSFEELNALFTGAEIDVQKCDIYELDTDVESSGRGYPCIGGVAGSLNVYAKHPENIKPVLIDGINKVNIRALKSFPKECPGNIVEVMSCEGGCVNGCATIGNAKTAARQIQNLVAGK